MSESANWAGAARSSARLVIECLKKKRHQQHWRPSTLWRAVGNLVFILCTINYLYIFYFAHLKSTTKAAKVPESHLCCWKYEKIDKYTQYKQCKKEKTKQNADIHVQLESFELSNKYVSDFCVPMYIAYTFSWLAFAGSSIIGVSRVTGTREAALGVSAAATSTTTSVVCCALVDICCKASVVENWNQISHVRP